LTRWVFAIQSITRFGTTFGASAAGTWEGLPWLGFSPSSCWCSFTKGGALAFFIVG